MPPQAWPRSLLGALLLCSLTLTVEAVSPPNAPSGLYATVSGDTVVFAWQAPIGGDPPTSYVLEFGSGTNRSDLASVDTGLPATTYTANRVPARTYYVRVRARNAAGTSGASIETLVTVFGPCVQRPNRPENLLVAVTGNAVSLSWQAPVGGCAPTGYQIEAGSSAGSRNLANFSTGSTSTSYAASNVANGSYFVRVRASGLGGAGDPSNEAQFSVPAGPGLPAIRQVGTLSVTGSPSAIAVSVARGKVYVADAGGGTVQVFDDSTGQKLTTITGCAGIAGNEEFVLDEAAGKIYASCGRHATTGILDGDGKVRVIDVAGDRITRVIDLGSTGLAGRIFAIDRTRHKLYVSDGTQMFVIDTLTDAVTPLQVEGARLFGSLTVNEVTNKIYVVRTGSKDMVEIDGNTLAASAPFAFEYQQPLHSGVNRRTNKLYVYSVGGPGNQPTVCIQDRSQATPRCTYLEGNDWGGIVANEVTNAVYLGVEIGYRIGILDGTTDRLVTIPMDSTTGISGSTNQSHKIAVNETSNHAFFINSRFLLAVDGATGQTRKIPYADPVQSPSSLVSQAIALNPPANRIYVIYDGMSVNKVAIFEDKTTN